MLAPLIRGTLVLCLGGLGAQAWELMQHSVNHRLEAAYSRDLRRLEAVDAELNHQLLESRAGLAKHYDAVVGEVENLRVLQKALVDVPGFFDDTVRWELHVALAESVRLLDEKAEHIERFKSHNAVLRNSLHFLPNVAGRVLAAGGANAALESSVGGLLGAVLSLGVTPEPAALERLTASIAELERQTHALGDGGSAADLALLLVHAQLILATKPLVERSLRAALLTPLGAAAQKLAELYSVDYGQALARQSRGQRLLYTLLGSSLALGLLDVILRLQQSRAALTSASRDLQQANRALALEREKERELGELRSRFATMMSHEFRTPLTAILSSSELLETYAERWDAERRQSHLERISSAVRSMNQMLEQVLVIGKAEAGMLRPNPTQLDLDLFCRNLLETLGAAAIAHDGEQDARTRTHYRFAGQRLVHLDELLLGHVLVNLLGNAVKYSPQGGRVELEVEVQDQTCRFVVRDQGIGIPEADLPGIFESFRRGSNVGKISGSGLGMAVVQRALGVLHGGVEVRSTLGAGSEFRVRIPIQTPPSEVS